MLIQYFDQKLRTSMEGESEMSDLSFGFLFQSPVVAIIFLVGFVVIAFLNGMKKIKIEVIYAGAIKLFLKDSIHIFRFMEFPARKLCCQHKVFPRIAFYQILFCRHLR